MTDRPPADPVELVPDDDDPTAVHPDAPPPDIQEIGSASRSCLVILVLSVVIVLLICVSWLTRVLF